MPAVFTTSFCRRKKEKIPPRQSLHTPIAGKPMARAIGFPCYPVSPNAACPRRLCQPPWTQPANRNPHPLSGGTPYAEATNANASRSSGERGLGGEALLSEKRPLPPASPTPASLQEGARGRGLLYREAPSLAIFFSLFLLVFNGDSAVEMGDFGGEHFPNVAGA